MSTLRYISLFSGIGGLEHPSIPPTLVCEQDEACQAILRRRYPDVEVKEDVMSLTEPPAADIVVGGWPCQDLSSAGTLGGINGRRSGLFFEMLRIGNGSGAHTLVGENVPNLLTINGGRDFGTVVDALVAAGYSHVAWRVLNARAFGLPQERRRLFIVASKDRERAEALHTAIPALHSTTPSCPSIACGFYWTGGKRSICFSPGYVPALKIGATDEKGRAPVAVMLGTRVRKLSSLEFLALQGFVQLPTEGLGASTLLRMAGNAVPVPMGNFVVRAVAEVAPFAGLQSAFGVIEDSGVYDGEMPWVISHPDVPLATNLADFIDRRSTESLSPQAAAGLIVRSVRSGLPMPIELFEILWELAQHREFRLRASRANSFAALDSMTEAVERYRKRLPCVSDYRTDIRDYDETDDSLEEDDADD